MISEPASGTAPPTQRASPSAREKLFNLALYEIGWFACVLGAASNHAGAGAALAAGLLLIHLTLAKDRLAEVKVALACGAVGLLLDSALSLTERLTFASPGLSVPGAGALAPFWVVMLWLQLGTTLRFSLGWLSGRYAVAAALGAVGGPIAFLGGERLGAAVWGEPRWLTALSLAFVWGLATPLVIAAADRIGAGRTAAYRRLR
ncbi:MAG: DUF2878 domain-containing protein [Thermoanaerobaculia bacterium]